MSSTAKEESFDAIIIGGGSAGYAAARTLREAFAKVAIVDAGQELGGLCILRGCMPSKTLLHVAAVRHQARNAGILGLEAGELKPDMARIQARKKEIIEDFASYRRESLESERFHLIRDKVTFEDPHTLATSSGKRLKANYFVIATGSQVSWPAIPGLQSPGVWTSDDVLNLDFLPESVLLLGGGIVACELGQFLVRMGTRVTMIQRSPHILKELTPDVSQVVEEALRADGIELFTDTQLQEIIPGDDGFGARFLHLGEEKSVQAKYLFNALGRHPATDGLGLEKIGVKLRTSGHVLCNANGQTTVPHIYAAGDCAGPHEIVHLAVQQGETAAYHIRGQKTLPPKEEQLLSVVFTDPPVAALGQSKVELEKSGQPFLSASYPFDDHGKSILMEEKRGFVRINAEKGSGRLLGVEIVGPEAGELIHIFSIPLAMGATVADCLKAPWYHPTLSEILTYPLEDILEEL